MVLTLPLCSRQSNVRNWHRQSPCALIRIRSSVHLRKGGRHLRPVQMSQLAAQLVFRPEDHHFDRRKLPIQRASNLGVGHSLVVTQKERNLIFFWQANQLFSYLVIFFSTQNLGE